MIKHNQNEVNCAMSTKRLNLPILSCGIFKWELEAILPEIERQLDIELAAKFLPPALDVNFNRMEETLRTEANSPPFNSTAPNGLLYGSMCHPKMNSMSGELGFVCPAPSNCAEMILSPERKRELDETGTIFYLTLGGLKLWREIYIDGHHWDDVDGRINFGYCDKIILLDSGVLDYTDEELFDFFEFTQTPIEVEPIDLRYFTAQVLEMCRKCAADSSEK
jgi:hypothetical protein